MNWLRPSGQHQRRCCRSTGASPQHTPTGSIGLSWHTAPVLRSGGTAKMKVKLNLKIPRQKNWKFDIRGSSPGKWNTLNHSKATRKFIFQWRKFAKWYLHLSIIKTESSWKGGWRDNFHRSACRAILCDRNKSTNTRSGAIFSFDTTIYWGYGEKFVTTWVSTWDRWSWLAPQFYKGSGWGWGMEWGSGMGSIRRVSLRDLTEVARVNTANYLNPQKKMLRTRVNLWILPSNHSSFNGYTPLTQ